MSNHRENILFNAMLRDKRLSPGSLEIHALMLSNSKEWTVDELQEHIGGNKKTMRARMTRLEDLDLVTKSLGRGRSKGSDDGAGKGGRYPTTWKVNRKTLRMPIEKFLRSEAKKGAKEWDLATRISRRTL